jgi:sugar phosphate isomerase/epimerase
VTAARIGLQLYTIRAECDRDLEGTVRRVGAQGYEGVELFQLHGHEPAQVRTWLDEASLVAAGCHARLDALETRLGQLADEVGVLGTDRIAISWIDPAWLAEPRPVLERIEAVARAARESGLRLGFHNHASEAKPLADGATFLGLLRQIDPELLWLELDLGWVWQAGGDPVGELEATNGRCPLVHVKDFSTPAAGDDVPVGDGIVGYEHVLPAALAAGVEWLVVEQDNVKGEPFADVERSLNAVRSILAA